MKIIDMKLAFGDMTLNNNPNRLVVHHIEAEGEAWTVEKIHIMHQTEAQFRFAGIGYHYYIRLNGDVYKGRPDFAVGAHAQGANQDTLGIAFEGDYDTRSNMPVEQFIGWCELKDFLDGKYGVCTVFGHREVGSSACPGRYFPLDNVKGCLSLGTGVPVKAIPTEAPLLERAKIYVGNRCAELQQLLISKGYDCGGYGADGSFGAGTLNSLLKFQKDNGLVADGFAGVITFNALTKAVAVDNGNPWIRALQNECNTQGYSAQKVDGFAGTNTLDGCPTIREGSVGNITRILQEKLNALGYGTNGIDGEFFGGTLAAVLAFQKRYGLSQDGVVGRNTWAKLLSL